MLVLSYVHFQRVRCVCGFKPQHAVLALVFNACYTLSLPSPILKLILLTLLLLLLLSLLLFRVSCCTSFSHYFVTHSHTNTQSLIYHSSVAHIHSGFYPTYQSISEAKELVESQTTFISISLKIQNLAAKNAHPHAQQGEQICVSYANKITISSSTSGIITILCESSLYH